MSAKNHVIELEFVCNVPALLKEQIYHGMRGADRDALRIPLQIFINYLGRVATRCAEINDPILNELMCKMALYEQSDPYNKEHDPAMVQRVMQDAANYRGEAYGRTVEK